MSSTGVSAGQKRKAQTSSRPLSADDRKRQKFQEGKMIAAQRVDAAVSASGELNIASFIKSREFELNALDKNMQKARKLLSTRAFQQVPRHLRRRTASHNAKKVPRRLRDRARREMVVDNTPTVTSKTRKPTSRLRLRLETAKALKKFNHKRQTVRQKKKENKANAAETDPSKHVDKVRIPRLKKNQLANIPMATSKFKRRQVHKTWLPTHLWHTKRAHMTQPTEPLWRMAIPLKPTEKSYRATHRASESRGCVAWDMSYVSTIGCLGTQTALQSMLKALGFHGHGWTGPKHKKWTAGSRFATGWLYQRDSQEALCEVDILWCALDRQKQRSASPLRPKTDVEVADETSDAKRQKTKLDRRFMIRVHPSAFHEIWTELLCAAKLQKPQVLMEDLRFEIGSIEIIGPGSTEALAGGLKVTEPNGDTDKLWNTLSSLSNPALLPMNVIISFKICDPRLVHSNDPKRGSHGTEDNSALLETVTEWKLDSEIEPSALFSHDARYQAGKLPSQWTINRRRGDLQPGQSLRSTSKDPAIPIVLLAHRPQSASTSRQGSWTVLAPWKCIDVIWRKLMFYKLSSGSKPRFGGLREKQQLAFEESVPLFPGDFPGTEAGKAWERTQSRERFDAWIRKPPSRRIAWTSLDLGLGRRGELGRGWACDWEFLFNDTALSHAQKSHEFSTEPQSPVPATQKPLTQRQRKAAKAKAELQSEETNGRNTSSPEPGNTIGSEDTKELQFIQLAPQEAGMIMKRTSPSAVPEKASLVTVKLTLLSRGTPNASARIYRIPLEDESSSDLAALSSAEPSTTPLGVVRNQNKSIDSLSLRQRWLAMNPGPSSSLSPTRTKKDKPNHRGLPRKAQHHTLESLRHINVLPKNAPPEIVEQYGPKPLSTDEKTLLMKQGLAVRMEEQRTWETHIPCPDAKDLIGFVTSGGYNLSLGKGTAIGAVWLQRVLEGTAQHHSTGSGTSDPKLEVTSKQHGVISKETLQKDWEQRLCVIRNSGESIGRLAIWELC